MPKPLTPAVWASGKTFSFQPSPAQQAQGFDYIATIRPGTGAPITDDHDWPLNQITKALSWILDSSLGYGSVMIGIPIPWPLQQMPQDIWTDIGMIFLPMTGQSFSQSTYQKLALAYPSLTVPDMRAEFIRGFDNGRGIDSGRALLSYQGDAIRNFTGSIAGVAHLSTTVATGVLATAPLSFSNISAAGSGSSTATHTIDASRSVPTAPENRPRSIAFNYIVRAL